MYWGRILLAAISLATAFAAGARYGRTPGDHLSGTLHVQATPVNDPAFADSVAMSPVGLPALGVASSPGSDYPPEVGSDGDYALIRTDRKGRVYCVPDTPATRVE